MQDIARILILFGIVLVAVGIFLFFLPKIPFLGRLPGDVYIQKKNFSFYFPLATSVLISIALSLLMWLFSRR